MTAIWGCFCVVGGLLMGPVGAMDFCWPVGGALRAVGWGGLGSLCAASKVEGLMGARALPSQVYPAGKLQWHFTCSFNFILILISISLIATWGHPCNLEATINGSCGNYGSLLVWGMALSWLLGGRGCGLCPKSRAWRTRASSSEVYLAGKLQWHFTCGFDFRHWLISIWGRFAVLKGLKAH